MATAGDELINPVTGLRTVFRHTSEPAEVANTSWR